MIVRTKMPLWRRAVRKAGARLFRWAENNDCDDADRNGEQWLLESLLEGWAKRPADQRVVLDVGANVGGYSARVLRLADRHGLQVRVLAFEPSRISGDSLIERFRKDARLSVVKAAVAEKSGTMRLFSPVPGSSHASLFERLEVTNQGGEEVEVVRMDEVLRMMNVTRVDLMKLDVEGAEFSALSGLGELLNPAVIRVIQFEYGGATLDARRCLRDLFELFEARGYVIAKLFNGSLEVRKYSSWMDHFQYANYVAMNGSDPDLNG